MFDHDNPLFGFLFFAKLETRFSQNSLFQYGAHDFARFTGPIYRNDLFEIFRKSL